MSSIENKRRYIFCKKKKSIKWNANVNVYIFFVVNTSMFLKSFFSSYVFSPYIQWIFHLLYLWYSAGSTSACTFLQVWMYAIFFPARYSHEIVRPLSVSGKTNFSWDYRIIEFTRSLNWTRYFITVYYDRNSEKHLKTFAICVIFGNRAYMILLLITRTKTKQNRFDQEQIRI